MSTYRPLSTEDVPDYLKSIPALKERLAKHQNLVCNEVGDGNLNLVFNVRGTENGAGVAVVKQALPYLRCAGEDWPLGRQRMLFESKALEIEGKICPGLVPELYHFDEGMSLVVMENLDQHRIMRKGLIERVKYPKFVGHMTRFLTRSLFFTSDLHMPSDEKKALVEYFSRNTELCKITEDFVFTNPFMESPDNRWNSEIDEQVQELRANTRLKLEIAELKDGFLARTQALIHGDLHTGSIMLNLEDTRVIDPEFAFFGPMGFDIGALLGNLVLAYCSHEIHSKDEATRAEYQGWLLDTIREIWNGFHDDFIDLWRLHNDGEATRFEFFEQCGGDEAVDLYRRRYVRRILQDTAGYAGCKMMRRQLGIAHVEDIECIEGPKLRAVAESLALSIGQRFIVERHFIESIDDMIDIVRTTRKEIVLWRK
ncbi:S-methyl-5-thioribose kinase [Candidatus Hydrogenedentota bacterium]